MKTIDKTLYKGRTIFTVEDKNGKTCYMLQSHSTKYKTLAAAKKALDKNPLVSRTKSKRTRKV